MKQKQILSLLLALLLLLGAVACAAKTPAASGASKTIKFTAIYDDVNKEFTIQTNETMLGAALLAEGLIAGDESEYGLYVKTVDGRTANDANQEWWCLTKGGEMCMTGVDSTEIADGDAYEFTLTVGW